MTPTPCEEFRPVPWTALAPSVWAWLPEREDDIDTANAGHVMPTSVVLDGGEALVIDPGPSHSHGLRIMESLKCRFGARVTWVVNTHAHAENVLGNSAFADAQALGTLRIAASRETVEVMRLRCPDCLRSMEQRAGFDAMAGTRIVLPDTVMSAGTVLAVGARQLRVLDIVRAHTDGDLLLWDATSRVLWVGGLVYEQRLPELAQGTLTGWLAVLDQIEALPVSGIVGTTWTIAGADGSPPPALTRTRRYLVDLSEGVLTAMDSGRMPQDRDVVPLPAYAKWSAYWGRHNFNVMRAWREMEVVWMDGRPPDPSIPQHVGR